MKEFEPRSFQKEVLDRLKETKVPPILFPPRRRPTYIGVDMAQTGADKSVIAQAKIDRDGNIRVWFDEYSEWPNYKWYRNPLKWLKWKHMMSNLTKQMKPYARSTPRSKNTFFKNTIDK